jgi:hypothetical protein
MRRQTQKRVWQGCWRLPQKCCRARWRLPPHQSQSLAQTLQCWLRCWLLGLLQMCQTHGCWQALLSLLLMHCWLPQS